MKNKLNILDKPDKEFIVTDVYDTGNSARVLETVTVKKTDGVKLLVYAPEAPASAVANVGNALSRLLQVNPELDICCYFFCTQTYANLIKSKLIRNGINELSCIIYSDKALETAFGLSDYVLFLPVYNEDDMYSLLKAEDVGYSEGKLIIGDCEKQLIIDEDISSLATALARIIFVNHNSEDDSNAVHSARTGLYGIGENADDNELLLSAEILSSDDSFADDEIDDSSYRA